MVKAEDLQALVEEKVEREATLLFKWPGEPAGFKVVVCLSFK